MTNETLKLLATDCLARIEAQGYRKLKGDRMAFEWMNGAAQALILTNHPDALGVHNFTVYILASRGAVTLRELLDKRLNPERFVK